MKHLIIFDLDGVVTSEEAYWDCAGLTLHELLFSPRYWNLAHDRPYQPAPTARTSRIVSRATLPEWLILSFKARALNSNWDTCYAAVCLHLVALLARLQERGVSLQPFEPWEAAWLVRLREQIPQEDPGGAWLEPLRETWREQHPLDLLVFHNATGLDLFERMDAYASEVLGYSIAGVFSRHKAFWRFCRDLFQEWLLGDALFASTYGHPPVQTEKPGCIYFEEPLLPVERTHATLTTLHEMGYTLGIASGRVAQEAEQPLARYDLWRYFDEQHRATYDVVVWAERALRQEGRQITLGKPHPFQFMAAVDRERALAIVKSNQQEHLGIPFIAVGDSTSDILSANAAGGLTIAVLTGARSSEARELLLKCQPHFVIQDITELPALLDSFFNLSFIQKIQFKRLETAERLLHLWFARQMNLAIDRVRLTPRATSLNSFNGFFSSKDCEYFFKTHVEDHGVLNEYYHARLLDQAGYHIVRPLRLLREKGRQMVIYPVVEWPVMFDLMRAAETGQPLPKGITAETLLEAERVECQHLLHVYARSFQPPDVPPQQAPPIHQLFWHRLSGERFQAFYEGKNLPLPTGNDLQAIPFEQVQGMRWIINGAEQAQTLNELVQQAREVLHPGRATATVVGHGDAHFGNVFLEKAPEDGGQPRLSTWGEREASSDAEMLSGRYLYFDPAFAGQHSPLLDIVKPLYHNVFAMWMYFPQEVARDLRLAVRVEDSRITIEHNYELTPIRRALLKVKQEMLLAPLLAWLETKHALPENWQCILNLALMCCPLLTVDLFNEQRPALIGWLGLSQALQLGNSGLEAWKEQGQR